MQRRWSDFASEYPERHGEVDQVENKIIHNKHEEILTTERRYPDGSLGIADSRLSNFEFTDEFGTSVFIDRKNQVAIIKFAGVNIVVRDGGVKIDAKRIRLTATEEMNLVGKAIFHIVSPVAQVLCDFWNVMSRRRKDSSK